MTHSREDDDSSLRARAGSGAQDPESAACPLDRHMPSDGEFADTVADPPPSRGRHLDRASSSDTPQMQASVGVGTHAVEREPAVAEALEVVEQSMADMAAQETRPLLEPALPSFRTRRFGDTDLSVFPIILGASTFGWTAGTEATAAVLDGYLDAGGNAVDTADSYSAGRSETLVGTWLRERGVRDRIILSTKIGRSAEHPGLSAQSITRAAEASLGRLGVDYIDLLYFHFDDPAVPLEESLTAADALLRSGKVRYLAAANFSGDRLMQARILAGQLDLPRFAAVQAHYNLVHREEFEHRLFPVVRAQRLAAVPYYALASGFLTGKYRGRARGERGSEAHSRAARAATYASKRSHRALDALERVAAEQDSAMASVALAWLLTKPLVTAPVVSVSRPEQLTDILAATRLHLTRHQVALLDRVSAL